MTEGSAKDRSMQPGSNALQEQGIVTRGVWRAPYRQDGCPVIIAVDSEGRRIAAVVLRRGLVPGRVKRTLTEFREAVDPAHGLRLVKAPPTD